MARSLPVGVYFNSQRQRYRVIKSVRGRLRSEWQPAGTTVEQAAQRAEAIGLAGQFNLHLPPLHSTSPTLSQDVQRYLTSVAAMPTYQQREQHLLAWVKRLGGERPRASVSAADIRAVLHGWRLAGLAPATVNKRRTSLMHLWSVLDGKSAPNPVRDVPKFREPDPQPRALSYATIRAILSKMPESRSKARLMVMAYAGIPAAEIRRIRPEHVDWRKRQVLVPGRDKGQGTRARVLPLTTQGVAAFRLMARLSAWGYFNKNSLGEAFSAGCRNAGIPKPYPTPYSLRHSFGTAVYRASGDLGATQMALGHSSTAMTWRYALGAVPDRLSRAISKAQGAMSRR